MPKWKNFAFMVMQQIMHSKAKTVGNFIVEFQKMLKDLRPLKLNFITLNFFKYNSSESADSRNSNTLSSNEILLKADKLFEDHQYIETLQYLKSIKACGPHDHEIYWRISRVLYKISCNLHMPEEQKMSLLDEALYSINLGFLSTSSNPNLFKWKAILLYAKSEYVDIPHKLKLLAVIKIYLLEAYKLNPQDCVVLYMLGHWCFQFASLSWFQRKVLSVLYCAPPRSTYEEAYYYLSKVEEIKPTQLIFNAYLLGRITYFLKQYYRSRYYLHLASSLPASGEKEVKIKYMARRLARKLDKYDVAQSSI